MSRASIPLSFSIDVDARLDDDPWEDEDTWARITAPLSALPAEGTPFCISFRFNVTGKDIRLAYGAHVWTLFHGYAYQHRPGLDTQKLNQVCGAIILEIFGNVTLMYTFEHHLKEVLGDNAEGSYHACLCKHGLLLLSTDCLSSKAPLDPMQALIPIVPRDISQHAILIRKNNLDACANALISRQRRVPVASIEGGANIRMPPRTHEGRLL